MIKRRKALLISLFAMIIVASFFILVSQFDNWFSVRVTEGHFSALENDRERQTVILEGKAYIPNDNIETFLLIGLDSFGKAESSDSYYNTNQADFLLVAAIDHSAKSCSFLQINRDTMTPVNMLSITGVKYDSQIQQIALSHTYGDGTYNSCLNTANAVSTLLSGAKINHYMSITMDAAIIINDYFGGTPVTMDKDYTDIDPAYKKGATIILSGNAALDFIRDRSSLPNSTNLYRMERQRLYMDAFVKNIASGSNDVSMTGLYSEIQDYTVTNCDASTFKSLMGYFGSYEIGEVVAPEGEAVRGAEVMEFYVDKEKLETIVAEMFFKEAN